jgi:NAD(P)H-dependent FMN reductase
MKYLVFPGTVRDSSPPNPPRLGLRVAKASRRFLEERDPASEVEMIDPLDFDLGGVFKPHFAYTRIQVPADLDALADKIASADGYVMVSPEYNHSMSPALAHLLNHFGSSLYAYKPSTIVTYSAGQWGGMRAAVGMRTFLSELGCLPVSAMIHVPKAHEVFDEEGGVLDGGENGWASYFKRAFSQMVWWAEAARLQRERLDPHQYIGNFKSDPSQRNAP